MNWGISQSIFKISQDNFLYKIYNFGDSQPHSLLIVLSEIVWEKISFWVSCKDIMENYLFIVVLYSNERLIFCLTM